jgi:hypothetical protein
MSMMTCDGDLPRRLFGGSFPRDLGVGVGSVAQNLIIQDLDERASLNEYNESYKECGILCICVYVSFRGSTSASREEQLRNIAD